MVWISAFFCFCFKPQVRSQKSTTSRHRIGRGMKVFQPHGLFFLFLLGFPTPWGLWGLHLSHHSMCTSHCLTLTAFINEQIGFFLPWARLQIDEKYLQKSWWPSPPPSPLLLYGHLHKKLIYSPFLVAMCLISHTLMFLLPCVMHFPQSIFTPLSSALLSWLRTSHKILGWTIVWHDAIKSSSKF